MYQGTTPRISLTLPDGIPAASVAALRVDLVKDGTAAATLETTSALSSQTIDIDLTAEQTAALGAGLYTIQTRVKTTDGVIHAFRDLPFMVRSTANLTPLPAPTTGATP